MEERAKASGDDTGGNARPSRILVQVVAGPAGRRTCGRKKRCENKLGKRARRSRTTKGVTRQGTGEYIRYFGSDFPK